MVETLGPGARGIPHHDGTGGDVLDHHRAEPDHRVVPDPDGGPPRLGVLDYGAVARLPEGTLPRTLGRLMRISLSDDYDAMLAFLRDEGPRYDPALAGQALGWMLGLFDRVLLRG